MAAWTKKAVSRAKAKFVEKLSLGLTVTGACRASALSKSTVYNWRLTDPEFARAYDEALEAGRDYLEDEAYRRAVEGVEEPLASGGKLVGTIRKYSDPLLIKLLHARIPDRYAPTPKNEQTGNEAAQMAAAIDADKPVLKPDESGPADPIL